MSDIIIRAEGVGKKYRIWHESGRRYQTLRERMAGSAKGALKKIFSAATFFRNNGVGQAQRSVEEFWALKGVSFEIRRGEVVGIIGRNGAGKSTLLKVLSRITEPTTGRIRISGRVASLLEVGTGFHPELTGRENIFLNGAVLGMTRLEIKRKFDEIVAFAEVEKFLDTPVKRYSNGMYVRLAFAVAAHLEPEILIVDEVLAVGDMEFQKKCLGKMESVAHREGRTVLFVSHNMGAVLSLCSRGIVLSKGGVIGDAPVQEACSLYVNNLAASAGRRAQFPARPGAAFSFIELQLLGLDGANQGSLDIFDPLTLHIRYQVGRRLTGVVVGICLRRDGMPLFNSFDSDENPEVLKEREPGLYESEIKLPRNLLTAGRYTISVVAAVPTLEKFDDKPEALAFELEELSGDFYHKSYSKNRGTMLIMPIKWRTRLSPPAPAVPVIDPLKVEV
jgi:lipopolysaccharide transport system ATP-binding protein